MAKTPKDKPRKPSPRSSPASGRGRKFKVFRTPIGFHDAYVAAPSRKAALEAWGADSNIFAQGIAEEVTDPALMEEPLARPGEVIRRARGSAEEHVAAADSQRPGKKEGGSRIKENRPSPRPSPAKRERRKKPSREELDAAALAVAGEIAAKDTRVVRMAKEAINGIDPVDVNRSYRFEQGFTMELNLAGVSDEHRDAFAGTEKGSPR